MSPGGWTIGPLVAAIQRRGLWRWSGDFSDQQSNYLPASQVGMFHEVSYAYNA
jgi:hypothetical protein